MDEILSENMIDVADQSIEQAEITEDVEISEEKQDVAVPVQQNRDLERDGAFARMRRETDQLKKQNEMLANTFKQFGFTGSTPEEIIDQANAHYLEKSVDEVRAERLAKEQESHMAQERDFYKSQLATIQMQEDLKKLQKVDPTIKSWESIVEKFGEEYTPKFFKLLTEEMDIDIAYDSINKKIQQDRKNPPATVGRINSSTKQIKDYYTKDEVDRMSESELDDPKIWARVRNSMTKW